MQREQREHNESDVIKRDWTSELAECRGVRMGIVEGVNRDDRLYELAFTTGVGSRLALVEGHSVRRRRKMEGHKL